MDVQRPFCANFVTNFSLTFLITYIFELSFPTRSPKKKAWQLSFFRPRSYSFFWKMKKSRYNWEKAVNLTLFKKVLRLYFSPINGFYSLPMIQIYCLNHHTDIFSNTLPPRSIAARSISALGTWSNQLFSYGR